MQLNDDLSCQIERFNLAHLGVDGNREGARAEVSSLVTDGNETTTYLKSLLSAPT